MADVYTWIITIRGIKSETKIILLVNKLHVDNFLTRQFHVNSVNSAIVKVSVRPPLLWCCYIHGLVVHLYGPLSQS